ncbi:hypothetical protein ASPFODRAFT_28462 [Aspergillus luchuensis CBS 106.47]|uniref:Uncharacterized protein n=1 Tax=Aspergillus luchuensis (strain CBS 106.47) TaxID=1137211 RepID=A0A1M3U1C3_ASPLC|nr:hypothetical protein ASPFODRAFT_28462 [Aspergillus luchuensis CBS 106.47]
MAFGIAGRIENLVIEIIDIRGNKGPQNSEQTRRKYLPWTFSLRPIIILPTSSNRWKTRRLKPFKRRLRAGEAGAKRQWQMYNKRRDYTGSKRTDNDTDGRRADAGRVDKTDPPEAADKVKPSGTGGRYRNGPSRPSQPCRHCGGDHYDREYDKRDRRVHLMKRRVKLDDDESDTDLEDGKLVPPSGVEDPEGKTKPPTSILNKSKHVLHTASAKQLSQVLTLHMVISDIHDKVPICLDTGSSSMFVV